MIYFLVYIVIVIVYFCITYRLFPLEIYHSNLNTWIGVLSPIILATILGIIGAVLEKKGIVKPPPPKNTPPAPPADTHVLSPAQYEPVLDELRWHLENQNLPVPAPIATSPPRQPTADEMLHSVDLLSGLGFERWCAQLLRLLGFSDIDLTKASGDQGVDIVAVKDDVRYAFQCKCYSSDIGNHPIQEVHAGKIIYHCHVGVVITNRYFTSGAKELAKATGTLLWDRDKLKSIIREVRKNKPDDE